MAVYKGNKRRFPNYVLYMIDGKVAPKKGPIRGQKTAESGLVLELAKEGILHKASGVYGFRKVVGNSETGIISLGEDYFYISKSGVTKKDGVKKQLGYAHLYQLNRKKGTFLRVLSPK